MNAIQNALNKIGFMIPQEILRKAFLQSNPGFYAPYLGSVNEQIMLKIIRGRVLSDCDIVGGSQVTIYLGDLPFEYPDLTTMVVRIPKSKTQGRTITSALSLMYFSGPPSTFYGYQYTGMTPYGESIDSSALAEAGASVMAAMNKIPITSTAQVELIAENVVSFKDSLRLNTSMYLRCVVSNDENLTNINIRYYPYFAKLVEYAVKSYIYNHLIVPIGTNELQGGFELGITKSIIESYADAEENYQDYLLNTWKRITTLNDKTAHRRFIAAQIGGNS